MRRRRRTAFAPRRLHEIGMKPGSDKTPPNTQKVTVTPPQARE
jgi:hypothetical protein